VNLILHPFKLHPPKSIRENSATPASWSLTLPPQAMVLAQSASDSQSASQYSAVSAGSYCAEPGTVAEASRTSRLLYPGHALRQSLGI